MTDIVERIAKLADAIYPEPPTTPTQPWRAWNKWRYCIDDMLTIATPGAQLGALVDLASHKFGPERAAKLLAEAAQGKHSVEEVMAALLAAMEDL